MRAKPKLVFGHYTIAQLSAEYASLGSFSVTTLLNQSKTRLYLTEHPFRLARFGARSLVNRMGVRWLSHQRPDRPDQK